MLKLQQNDWCDTAPYITHLLAGGKVSMHVFQVYKYSCSLELPFKQSL